MEPQGQSTYVVAPVSGTGFGYDNISACRFKASKELVAYFISLIDKVAGLQTEFKDNTLAIEVANFDVEYFSDFEFGEDDAEEEAEYNNGNPVVIDMDEKIDDENIDAPTLHVTNDCIWFHGHPSNGSDNASVETPLFDKAFLTELLTFI